MAEPVTVLGVAQQSSMTSASSASVPPSQSSIARKGLPIVLATLISRPLGFLREAVQAALFGASRLMDAFLVAFNVPEMIQTLFFSGVLSNFFVPVITRYREDRAELARVFSVAVNGALLFAVALAGICYVIAPELMWLAAPGLSGTDRELAIFLFRLMLPMLVLHCLLAVVKGALNSVDHYAMPEYAGVFFNLVMILCALLLTGSFGITSLAIGVIGGSFVQLLVQIPVLAQKGIRYQPSAGVTHPALREMGGLAVGAFIATAVVPVNAFIARALASSLPEGSISALAYAFRIFILPVSLFAVPVYTVLLTDLSAAQQQGARDRFKKQAVAGLSLLFVLGLPATAVIIALATPITRLLYERGQFTAADTLMTSQALMAYGAGIVAYGASQVMVRLFNAAKDTTTPAWVGAGSIALNAVGCWLLMRVFGHWGIALVTSLVSCVNALVLYLIFRHRHGALDEGLLVRRFVVHCGLAIVLGVVLFFLGRSLAVAPGSLLSPLHLLQFAWVVLAGAAVYLVVAYLFKVEEVLALSRNVLRKL